MSVVDGRGRKGNDRMSERSALRSILPMNCLLWQLFIRTRSRLDWMTATRTAGQAPGCGSATAAQDGGLRDAWRRKRAVVAVHARCGSRS